jgi:hypothetical protein
VTAHIDNHRRITALGLPALQLSIPLDDERSEPAFLGDPLAVDILRISHDPRDVSIFDALDLEVTVEMATTLASNAKQLDDAAGFREYAHI